MNLFESESFSLEAARILLELEAISNTLSIGVWTRNVLLFSFRRGEGNQVQRFSRSERGSVCKDYLFLVAILTVALIIPVQRVSSQVNGVFASVFNEGTATALVYMPDPAKDGGPSDPRVTSAGGGTWETNHRMEFAPTQEPDPDGGTGAAVYY